MKKTRMLALTLVLAAGVTACSGTDTVDDTIDDATAAAVETAEEATDTTLAEDSAEAVAKLQTSLDVLTAELDDAELDPAVETAWSEIQVRVTDAIVAAQAETEFDDSVLEDSLDSFEEQLDAAEPAEELESAWDEFRSALSSLIASLSG